MFPKQALLPAPHQPLAISLGPNGPDSVAVPVVSVARPRPDVPPPQQCRRSRAVALSVILVVWGRRPPLQ
eukprot:717315-Rhodomonas_salina.1